MKPFALLLLPLLVVMQSCESPTAPVGMPDTGESSPLASLPSDEAIIAKVYDPNYGVPDGFFVDERANSAQSYTVHHLTDDSGSYEVCTDDIAIAESWESADNASRSVGGYYVGAYENDRYFEFIRELSYDDDVGNVDDLTSPGFARVFKCSHTERDGVDRGLLTGYAGTLNVRPLTAAVVRDFSEYLWQFTYFPQRYKKVLASYPFALPGGSGHSLLLAFASGQGNGKCDLIDIVEWRFEADATSGHVQTESRNLRQFESEVVDGSPQLCE